MRVFQMLQTGTLNRHVVLVLLDAVFCSVFPEVRSSSSSSYNLDGPKASCPFLPSRGQEGREQALEQALLQAMAQVRDRKFGMFSCVIPHGQLFMISQMSFITTFLSCPVLSCLLLSCLVFVVLIACLCM